MTDQTTDRPEDEIQATVATGQVDLNAWSAALADTQNTSLTSDSAFLADAEAAYNQIHGDNAWARHVRGAQADLQDAADSIWNWTGNADEELAAFNSNELLVEWARSDYPAEAENYNAHIASFEAFPEDIRDLIENGSSDQLMAASMHYAVYASRGAIALQNLENGQMTEEGVAEIRAQLDAYTNFSDRLWDAGVRRLDASDSIKQSLLNNHSTMLILNAENLSAEDGVLSVEAVQQLGVMSAIYSRLEGAAATGYAENLTQSIAEDMMPAEGQRSADQIAMLEQIQSMEDFINTIPDNPEELISSVDDFEQRETMRAFFSETAADFGYDGSVFTQASRMTEAELAQTESFQQAARILFERENGQSWEAAQAAGETNEYDATTIGDWGVAFMSEERNQFAEVIMQGYDLYLSDNFTMDQKMAFLYASETFDLTRNDFGTFRRAAWNTVTDEANILSAVAAVATLGGSTAAVEGGKRAAQQTFMTLVREGVQTGAMRYAQAEAATGAIDGALQANTDIDLRGQTGLAQTSLGARLGATAVGAGIGAASDYALGRGLGVVANTLTDAVTGAMERAAIRNMTPDVAPSPVAPSIDSAAPSSPEFVSAETAPQFSVSPDTPFTPANAPEAPASPALADSAPAEVLSPAPRVDTVAPLQRAAVPGSNSPFGGIGRFEDRLAASVDGVEGIGPSRTTPPQPETPAPDAPPVVEAAPEAVDFANLRASRVTPAHVAASGFDDYFEDLSAADIGSMRPVTLQAAFDGGYFEGLKPDQIAAAEAKRASVTNAQNGFGGPQAQPQATPQPQTAPQAEAVATEAKTDANATPKEPSFLGRALNVRNWFSFQTKDIIVNRDTPLEGGKWPGQKYNIYERNMSVLSTPNYADDSYVNSTGKLVNGNFFRMENDVHRLENGLTSVDNRAKIVRSLLERGYVNAAIEGLRNAQIKGKLEPELISALENLNGPAKHITDKQYEFIRYIFKEGAPDFTKKLARSITTTWTPLTLGLDYSSYLRYPRTTLWNIGYYFKGDKLPQGLNSTDHESRWIPRLKTAQGKDGEKLEGITSGDFGNTGRIVGRAAAMLSGWTPTYQAVKFVATLPGVMPAASVATVAWLATSAVDTYNNGETEYSRIPDAIQMGMANAALTVADNVSAIGTLPTGVMFGTDSIISQPAQGLNSGINYVQDWLNGDAQDLLNRDQTPPAEALPADVMTAPSADQAAATPSAPDAGATQDIETLLADAAAAPAAVTSGTPPSGSDGSAPAGGGSDQPQTVTGAPPATPISQLASGNTSLWDMVMPDEHDGRGGEFAQMASDGLSAGRGMLSTGFNYASDFYNHTLPAMVGEKYAPLAQGALAILMAMGMYKVASGAWTAATNISPFKIILGIGAAIGVMHLMSGSKDENFRFDDTNTNSLSRTSPNGFGDHTLNDYSSETRIPGTSEALPRDNFRPGLVEQASAIDRVGSIGPQFASMANSPSIASAGPYDIVIPSLASGMAAVQGSSPHLPSGLGALDFTSHDGSFDIAGISQRDLGAQRSGATLGYEHRMI